MSEIVERTAEFLYNQSRENHNSQTPSEWPWAAMPAWSALDEASRGHWRSKAALFARAGLLRTDFVRDKTFVPPAARDIPLGALNSAAEGADALTAWAQSGAGRNMLAHALVKLQRDGWLRDSPDPASDSLDEFGGHQGILLPSDPESAR